MSLNGKPSGYFSGCNERLLHTVPTTARHVLDIGCGEGNLGAAIKQLNPDRTVWGIESNADAARKAAERLDKVFTVDFQNDDVPVEAGSIDCVIFGNVLEHLVSPERVFRQARTWLAPGGVVLCSAPNVQHHSMVTALLRSNFQYAESGLLDRAHLRFFTYSTLIKLFLDAGFEPEIIDTTVIPAAKEFLKAVEPLLKYLGLQPSRTSRYLDAYQYIIKGTPLPETPTTQSDRPLSFVACVSNEQILQANLLASPCLRTGTPHEILLVRNCRSAAEGLNEGLRRAKHEVSVCVHQDVYLPDRWVERFWQQYDLARERYAPLGVLGVYGIHREGAYLARAGCLVDRDSLLRQSEPLPAAVETLDDVLLGVPKRAFLQFDPALGFHFYGADICLAARTRGLQAIAVDATCFHNSPHDGAPAQFRHSAQALAAKWGNQLPLVMARAVIDRAGALSVA